jgi:hypothetical protein
VVAIVPARARGRPVPTSTSSAGDGAPTPTIGAAAAAGTLDRVVVTTDERVAEAARGPWRPRSLSCGRRSWPPTIPSSAAVIAHAVQCPGGRRRAHRRRVVLQATTPFREATRRRRRRPAGRKAASTAVGLGHGGPHAQWRQETGLARAPLREGRPARRADRLSTRRTARWSRCGAGARLAHALRRHGSATSSWTSGRASPSTTSRTSGWPSGSCASRACSSAWTAAPPRHGPRLPLAGHRGCAAQRVARRRGLPHERRPRRGPGDGLPPRLPGAGDGRRKAGDRPRAHPRLLLPPSSSTTCPPSTTPTCARSATSAPPP